MLTWITPAPGSASWANVPRSRSMMRPAPCGPRSVTTQVVDAPVAEPGHGHHRAHGDRADARTRRSCSRTSSRRPSAGCEVPRSSAAPVVVVVGWIVDVVASGVRPADLGRAVDGWARRCRRWLRSRSVVVTSRSTAGGRARRWRRRRRSRRRSTACTGAARRRFAGCCRSARIGSATTVSQTAKNKRRRGTTYGCRTSSSWASRAPSFFWGSAGWGSGSQAVRGTLRAS